jgi:aminoglycoside 2'-N-acetyltransferase I
MERAQEVMRQHAAIDFGYLGCREEVVGFYKACGWTRISVPEVSLSREGGTVTFEQAGAPILICEATRSLNEWPEGDIDLRGLPW